MIPKIIHQIWVGPDPPPLYCMESWSADYVSKHPGWEYVVWDEKKISKLKMINQEIYDKETTYRGKSDIARYEIIYQHGGMFIDADSLWINDSDLDKLYSEVNESDFFACHEPVNKHLLANGIFGASAKNNITMKIIERLSKNYQKDKKNNPHPHSIWLVTGPDMFTKSLDGENITRFPSYYFLPEPFVKNSSRMIACDKIPDSVKYPGSYMYQFWMSHYLPADVPEFLTKSRFPK